MRKFPRRENFPTYSILQVVIIVQVADVLACRPSSKPRILCNQALRFGVEGTPLYDSKCYVNNYSNGYNSHIVAHGSHYGSQKHTCVFFLCVCVCVCVCVPRDLLIYMISKLPCANKK